MKQLIHGGRLLTAGQLEGRFADLLIDGDTIVAVLAPGESVTSDARRVDATNRLLIPGLINSHTHATVALGKAMADRWSLELLLNAYPWTAGGRTAETKYLSAKIGALEMLQKGCTACYDLAAEIPAPSVEGINAVARAYSDVGMRAVIAPMMADTTFFRAIPGLIEAMPAGLREKAEAVRATPYDVSLGTCRELIENWSWDREQLRPALGPTIPHHCSDAFITGCRDLAKAHGIGVQMHVAESKVQAIVGPRKYGTTLVGHLQKLGLMAPNFTAAHAIWLDDDDMTRLADAGASVAHNPGSNLKLGSGLGAARKMQECGITFGLGTDGCLSSDNQNMFEAMRLAAYISRVQGPDPRQWLRQPRRSRPPPRAAPARSAWRVRSASLRRASRPMWSFRPDPHQLRAAERAALSRRVRRGRHRRRSRHGRWSDAGGGGQGIGTDMPGLALEAHAAVEHLDKVNAGARDFVQLFEPVVLDYCVGLAREPYHVQRWCEHCANCHRLQIAGG